MQSYTDASDGICECPMSDDRPINANPTNCPAMSDGGYSCTRPEGHDGPHSACSVSEHPIVTWENDD